MSAAIDHDIRVAGAERIFSRVLVGVDGSAASLDAARQAALLKAPSGTLLRLCLESRSARRDSMTVLPPSPTTNAQPGGRRRMPLATRRSSCRRRGPKSSVAFPPRCCSTRSSATGPRWWPSDHEVSAGSRDRLRVDPVPAPARCTVLGPGDAASRHAPPRRIAVGVDGSRESAAAYAAARHLADRFHAELAVVIAEGDTFLDLAAVSLIVGDDYHVIPSEPVSALTAASRHADLLVLGSRGLHGLKSLGSVSERAAHRAQCSTLIVRAT